MHRLPHYFCVCLTVIFVTGICGCALRQPPTVESQGVWLSPLVLETPSYKITITGLREGEVSTDNLQVSMLEKATGKAVSRVGRTLHSMASDGITPGRFLGYAFENERDMGVWKE